MGTGEGAWAENQRARLEIRDKLRPRAFAGFHLLCNSYEGECDFPFSEYARKPRASFGYMATRTAGSGAACAAQVMESMEAPILEEVV